MNNLLRTLTESQAKLTFPDVDLRLLLSNVKEGRRQSQDAKLSDPFYDSLEGLLQDLRTVTPDNRDAEAFLKPVSRADVPDYYDVISSPMDLQTMLKKVKQKQYKSKREFQDDLDLIWSNCFMYNAAENHPLRQCSRRLSAKAESLLKNITDRKDRTDPFIPLELGHPQTSGSLRIRINGAAASGAHITNVAINGRGHRLLPASSNGLPARANTPFGSTIGVARPRSALSRASSTRSGSSARQEIPFAETLALVRTQEGMLLFDTIDKDLDRVTKDANVRKQLTDKLIELAPPYDYCEGVDDESSQPVVKTEPDSVDSLSAEVGEKRKLAEQINTRPRKRARFGLSSPRSWQSSAAHSPTHDTDELSELTELWWGAVQSDALLANGLPRIQVSSSKRSARIAAGSGAQPLPPTSPQAFPAPTPSCLHKLKSRHKAKYLKAEPNGIEAGPLSLVSLINANIKTMKRVRHTHGRFAALVANATAATGADESVDGTAPGADGFPAQMGIMTGPSEPASVAAGSVQGDEESLDVVDDKVDQRPWLQRYIDAAQVQDDTPTIIQPVPSAGASSMKQDSAPKVKKKSKRKRRSRLPIGIDMGEEIADDCVRWMGEKVLEHLGFQGTSSAALEVLANVTKEYFYNVGRTIKFLSDKYAQTMTAEEIVLHTLFESGTSKVQDLERYIMDDIKRHGTRLGELEKKLVSAYRESAANEVQEDEGLFEEEDEEEAGPLATGDFADLLGEDFLGLRELGIAAEFGMSSLTIPKKLLRSKKTQKATGNTSKPKEPPPPYPPPPPFILLTYDKLDVQIGLLKPFYRARFAARASSLAQNPGPPSSQPAPDALQEASTSSRTAPVPPEGTIQPDLELPDDPPNPSQVKIGPIGQIVRPSTASGPGKKKSKNVASAAGQPGPSSGGPSGGASGSGAEVPGSVENSPKKKGATGIGSGNGRKKKSDAGTGQAESTQSPVLPPAGFNQNHNRAGQSKGVVIPPVVVASA